MKKFLCGFFVLAFSVCLLCGCALDLDDPSVQTDPYGKYQDTKFFVSRFALNNDAYIYYLRDPLTDVMYMYIDDYRAAGLSVMLKADGSPLLFSEWIVMNEVNDDV